MGVHTGPALNRAGDWWGATVNLAARVAGAAEANQLLVTEATKLAAGHMASTRLSGLGARRFKNIPLPVRSTRRPAACVAHLAERLNLPPGGDS